MASEIRVNKIENRSGLGTVTFADTGVDLAGIVTATTFSGSGASLTNVPDSALSAVTSSKLTGALPALDGSALTGVASTDNIRTNTDATFLKGVNVSGIATVGSAVTISESGIEASGIGITCANINGGQISGRRNLIINGAMNVAQRGTSHTPSNSTSTYQIDRFIMENNNGGAYTVSQSTTVPSNQFKNSLKLDVTTADTSLTANQYCQFQQRIEAQNLQAVQNFRQPITISFWESFS